MRYFLFTYAYANDMKYGNGNILIISDEFPSQEWIKSEIKNTHVDKAISDIAITGWNEFKTENDFNLFTGKSDEEEA